MSGLEIAHKRKLHVFRWFMLLVLIAFLGAYAYYGIRWFRTGEASPLPLPVAAADGSVDESRISRSTVDSYKVPATEPRYLVIDDYLVKARVQKAGLTKNNMFTMPSNLDDVMWYDKSGIPGSGIGAVIISGRNIGISRDGVFSKLAKLKTRDEIKIERGDGRTINYEVRDIKEKPLTWVNKSGMAEMMVSLDPAKEGLSLIADSGKWIPKAKEFDSRIIVRAVQVD